MNSSFEPAVRYDLTDVNELARQDPIAFVRRCEEEYAAQVQTLAGFLKNSGQIKFIMIAGPSASGKTTTSLKLRQELERMGIRSVAISLDNFLFDRETLPILEDGTRDYESIATLDIGLLNRCLEELLTNNRSNLPIFDFVSGLRLKTPQEMTITGEHVVIIEGLHALNPAITDNQYKDRFLKVYISPQVEVYEGGRQLLDGQTLRLMRRMIRDFKFRGSDPENTFHMWKNVCKGEKLYIDPFRKDADYLVNSLHLYEPSVYHHDLVPILRQVKQQSKFYSRSRELVQILEDFDDLDFDLVPKDSMIREFLG